MTPKLVTWLFLGVLVLLVGCRALGDESPPPPSAALAGHYVLRNALTDRIAHLRSGRGTTADYTAFMVTAREVWQQTSGDESANAFALRLAVWHGLSAWWQRDAKFTAWASADLKRIAPEAQKPDPDRVHFRMQSGVLYPEGRDTTWGQSPPVVGRDYGAMRDALVERLQPLRSRGGTEADYATCVQVAWQVWNVLGAEGNYGYGDHSPQAERLQLAIAQHSPATSQDHPNPWQQKPQDLEVILLVLAEPL